MTRVEAVTMYGFAMTGRVTNPSEQEIRTLLLQVRTIAVVGLSPKAERPSHRVAARLKGFGYRIIPVRPGISEVLGEKAYRTLYDLPEPVDIVDVFRSPDQVDEIVDACIELNIPAIWLQDGVVNQPAAERAREAGITVVMDRCMYRDYRKLVEGEEG
jgi:predicted CoA-binding protein